MCELIIENVESYSKVIIYSIFISGTPVISSSQGWMMFFVSSSGWQKPLWACCGVLVETHTSETPSQGHILLCHKITITVYEN